MPELTGIHIGLLALMLVVGAALGWFLRGDRCAREKIVVNADWQKELDARQAECDQLAEQNKSLVEQISQHQASQKDHSNRTRELADSLKETIARVDERRRQAKDLRQALDIAVTQRDKLRKSLKARDAAGSAAALKEKDEKIFRLSRELTSWQSRVPPLVERFQARDREARELFEALEHAEERIAELEELTSFDQTRIEAMNAESLPAGGYASNEPDAEETGGGETEADSPDLVGETASRETQADVPGADSASVEDAADDLQMIKGIGPSIEKTLNELGICRYQQIADLSEYEIDRVAQQIKGFRSRIYRENWIGQARDLLYEQTSGRS